MAAIMIGIASCWRNKMKPSTEIQNYIETKILPRYGELGGHTGDHINYVISRSLRFAEQAPGVNIDMVYIIAAYHDLGRLIDNETHNFESAKMLRNDDFLKAHFSPDEIEMMAEAVEDHRASLGREPRSVYGKIVSSADRDINFENMLSRVFDYTRHIHPEMTEEEVLEEARIHLREKYAKGGYALKTMYFDDPDFNSTVDAVENATRDFETFSKIMREHNKKRNL